MKNTKHQTPNKSHENDKIFIKKDLIKFCRLYVNMEIYTVTSIPIRCFQRTCKINKLFRYFTNLLLYSIIIVTNSFPFGPFLRRRKPYIMWKNNHCIQGVI